MKTQGCILQTDLGKFMGRVGLIGSLPNWTQERFMLKPSVLQPHPFGTGWSCRPSLASGHCFQALSCSKWWLAVPGRPYASCCFDCLPTLEVIKALKGKATALITLNVNTVAFTLGLESLLMNWTADEPFSFLSHGLFLYKMRLRSVQLHENIVGIKEQYQTL